MGIHYDYKNTRNEKKLRKEHKRQQRRSRKNRAVKTEQNTIPLDRPITLDDLTNPDNK